MSVLMKDENIAGGNYVWTVWTFWQLSVSFGCSKPTEQKRTSVKGKIMYKHDASALLCDFKWSLH